MTDPGSGAIVFAGPCLAGLDERVRRDWLAGFELRPPAQRGDVLAAMARRPHTLVLLDGYYYTVGAVTHKELLYALEAGVRVFGAASMGALRAVEMEPFGMTGVGRVFSWYRDGTLDGDDEVAVLHAPAERAYRPFTVALVEVRAALDHLIGRGELDAARAGRLVEALKELPFTERSHDAVSSLAADLLGERGSDLLRDRLAGDSVKQRDAKAALDLARLTMAADPGLRPPHPRRAVDYFSFDRESYLTALPAPAAGRRPTLVDVWAMAQLLHGDAPGLVEEMRERYLLGAAALGEGLGPSPECEASTAGRLEARLRQLGSAAMLPQREVREEARSRALGEAARRHWGGADGALGSLAERLGLPPGGERARLLEALEGRAGHLPAWWMARAFVFSPAFPAALATVLAALEVRHRFEIWARGSVIRRQQLRSVAMRLWTCADEEIEAQASRRGLLDFGVRSLGLYEALNLLAPAEMLRRPLNEYPGCRDELRAVPFSGEASILGDATAA